MERETEIQNDYGVTPDYTIKDGIITHITSGKVVPDVPVTYLGLKTSTVNRLVMHKITTLSQLLAQTRRQLLKIPKIGLVSLDEIRHQVPLYLETHQTDAAEGQVALALTEYLYPVLAPGYTVVNGRLRNKSTGKEIPDEPIQILNLSERARNGIARIGIQNVSGLVGLSLKKLSSINNVGIQTVNEIQEKLRQYLESNHESGNADSEQTASLIEYLYPVLVPDYTVVNGRLRNKKTGKEIPDVPIDFLGLSAKARTGIARIGIQNASELVGLSLKTLSSIKNVGTQTVNEIQEKLNRYLERGHECSKICTNETAPLEGQILYIFRNHDFEELPFDDVRVYFGGMDSAKLLECLERLVHEDKLMRGSDGYCLPCESFRTFIENICPEDYSDIDERAVSILKMRVSGSTLSQIGEKQGLTREGVRQLEKKAFRQITHAGKRRFSEDKYAYLFCTYVVTKKESFLHYIGGDDYSWYYLNARYEKGRKDIQTAIEDENLSEELRQAIYKYVHSQI